VGTELAYESLERSVRILAGAPADEVAARFELDPERVRLLPAGVLIFEALTSVLGHPLMIGKGGLREGIILEQLAP
jgi:exopolyphosphatase/guanosine-5'-triphosphate,3'-diphosphate pyrophosphatase